MDFKEVWLIDYCRTAFSRSRPGSPERDVFGEYRGDELLAKIIMHMFDNRLADKGVEKKDVDSAIMACALPVHENWTYGAKIPLWLADMPNEISSYFVDKQCGSAGTAVSNAALEIMTGHSKAVLCGGMEHMTRIGMNIQFNPHIKPNMNTISKKSEWYRPNIDIMTAVNMLQTAQKLYEEESPHFVKEDLDKFGVRAHNLTVQSQEAGWFKDEIIPIEGHVEGNVEEKMMVDKDMAARKSNLESVSKLRRISKPYYLKQNIKGEDLGGRKGYMEREGTKDGVITAGNSSPLNAGATTCLLMDAEEAKKRGIEPMAKIVSLGWAGVDPSVMGRGPVPASEMALEKAGLKSEDIDFWEINEAFCIVALNCMKYLNIPEEKVNIMGGSSAIGHPLGATMIRLPGTLARILKDKKAKYGIANACCGGGQGVAILLENLDA